MAKNNAWNRNISNYSVSGSFIKFVALFGFSCERTRVTMTHLHNRVEGKVLKEKLAMAENVNRTTLSFYKYHNLSDPDFLHW